WEDRGPENMSAAEASMSGGQGKSRRPLSRGKKFWEEWLAQAAASRGVTTARTAQRASAGHRCRWLLHRGVRVASPGAPRVNQTSSSPDSPPLSTEGVGAMTYAHWLFHWRDRAAARVASATHLHGPRLDQAVSFVRRAHHAAQAGDGSLRAFP